MLLPTKGKLVHGNSYRVNDLIRATQKSSRLSISRIHKTQLSLKMMFDAKYFQEAKCLCTRCQKLDQHNGIHAFAFVCSTDRSLPINNPTVTSLDVLSLTSRVVTVLTLLLVSNIFIMFYCYSLQ